MKKVYTAPEILFESFVMSTNIAGDCEAKTNLPSNNSCGIYFTGIGNVFMDNMNGCEDRKIAADESFNGICYHAPTETNNLFNS